jgi:predicted nucleic acid-binding protein
VNVFVETNFVLELALEQQESPSCEKLVNLASAKSIRLLLPAYSFVEPHETLIRRQLNRRVLRSQVSNELAQLARSEPLAERAAASQEIVNLLAESDEYEARRIERMKQRLYLVGEVLPLDLNVLRRAAVCQADYDLSPQDAIVYASIRARLQLDHASRSCFVSRNPRDFDDADLLRDLESLNCKYFSSFATGLQYIEHVIASPPGSE